jgi:hypothetical protein
VRYVHGRVQRVGPPVRRTGRAGWLCLRILLAYIRSVVSCPLCGALSKDAMPSPRRAGAGGAAEPGQAEVSLPPVTAQRRCRWCDLAHSPAPYDLGQLVSGEGGLCPPGSDADRRSVAYEGQADEAAFVALREVPAGPGLVGGFTLVPRKHVRTLTELPPPEMAEVLAGLSSATVALEKLPGVARIEIHADSYDPAGGEEHVRFRVEPVAITSEAGGSTRDDEGHGRRRSRRGANASTRPLETVPTRRGC